jgi:putative two-component system response regulator
MNASHFLDEAALEIARRLRLVCEAHEPSIGAHLDRVSHYACAIGSLMSLSPVELSLLRHAAPLHDIGKIGLPTELLNKPGSLTQEERRLVESHTVIGYRILEGSRSPLLQWSARIALSHHEAWNGTGYPHRLAGRNIPLEARVVAIADVYDALLSCRAYKPAWDEEAALDELRRQREKKFDPEILDLFLANVGSFATAEP